MPGRVDNPSDWYERAELFALASRFEGFPNVLLEALSYGVPAVATDCESGPRDILRDGIDGLLVVPDDVVALAEALARLMNDRELRCRMSANAIEVRERFAPARIGEQWSAVLQ
jgi:glycosyltransferase involved in cell wall biosynthesis